MQKKLLLILLLALSIAAYFIWSSSRAGAPFQVHRLFQDNMIMQSGTKVPVWGWGRPGDKIVVSLGDEYYSAEVSSEGDWEVDIPSHPAGGPHHICISSGLHRVHLKDIYFGDVWLCSGQSNMAWKLKDAARAAEEIPKATFPGIRHFKVPGRGGFAPVSDLEKGDWKVATPETVGDFTAIGYYFAKEINQYRNVPVGLINVTWGSSRIRSWMSPAALGYNDYSEAERQISFTLERKREQQRQVAGTAKSEDPGMDAQWYDPGLDDSSWREMKLPGYWEVMELKELNGVVWFRKTFELPDGTDLTGFQLHAGKVNDSDITWINGQKVGSTENAWSRARIYDLPAGILQSGKNVVVIRVEDPGQSGGIHGDPELLRLESESHRKSLAGIWKYNVGAVYPADWERTENIPTQLFNQMIYPLCKFPVKGVLWYQGESDVWWEDAAIYDSLLADMITDWRQCWRQEDLPFIYAQVANIASFPNGQDDGTRWALLRESQSKVTDRVKKTAQVITFDISEPESIHPLNKHDVGKRMARAARNLAYEEDVVWSGPVFQSMELSGDTVLLSFSAAAGGLVAKGGDLKGFTIAGPDRVFYEANARIANEKVAAWSEKVAYPEAVRYAWDRSPVGANLYNAEGLPAVPFRTDIGELENAE